MTRAPRLAPLERSVLRVARTMIRGGFRHVPVIAGADHMPTIAVVALPSKTSAVAASDSRERVIDLLSLSDVVRSFATGIDSAPLPTAALAVPASGVGSSDDGRDFSLLL